MSSEEENMSLQEKREKFVRELRSSSRAVRLLALLALMRKYVIDELQDPQMESSSEKLVYLFESQAAWAVERNPWNRWIVLRSLGERLKNEVHWTIEDDYRNLALDGWLQ